MFENGKIQSSVYAIIAGKGTRGAVLGAESDLGVLGGTACLGGTGCSSGCSSAVVSTLLELPARVSPVFTLSNYRVFCPTSPRGEFSVEDVFRHA